VASTDPTPANRTAFDRLTQADPVLTDVLEELAEDVGGRRRVAHDEPPGAPELRVDVLVRTDLVVLQRPDEAVDAVRIRVVRVVGAGTLAVGLEAGVVDDEGDVRVAGRGRTDVARVGELRGRADDRRDALVRADDLGTDLAYVIDEPLADLRTALVVVVEEEV